MNKVSVFGLGKLGTCLAVAFASRNVQVLGVDTNESTVNAILNERVPEGVVEPNLTRLFDEVRVAGLLTVGHDTRAAVHSTEASFIIVPTPSDFDGRFSSKNVIAVAREIGTALRDKQGRHLVVVCSTVMPGTCENEVIPALEAASGKACGTDFEVAYNPEFIALGNVVEGLLHPDFVLVGASSISAQTAMTLFYKKKMSIDAPVEVMTLAEAEISKIAVNGFVTMKISFANALAAACERYRGANVDRVTDAIAKDTRIGKRYLRAGTAYGGPCFPRDSRALGHVLCGDGLLAEATDGINNRVISKLLHLCMGHQNVFIWGLSYKPGHYMTDESTGMRLAKLLALNHYRVHVYDENPRAVQDLVAQLGQSVMPVYVDRKEEALSECDAIILLSETDTTRALRPERFEKTPRRVVIDPWRQLVGSFSNQDRVTYRPLGVGVR